MYVCLPCRDIHGVCICGAEEQRAAELDDDGVTIWLPGDDEDAPARAEAVAW